MAAGSFLAGMLKAQYRRTMDLAYAFARRAASEHGGHRVLDCGSGAGHEYDATFGAGQPGRAVAYRGLEWSPGEVEEGIRLGRDIKQADLNKPLPVDANSQDCVIAYSVLEHLLMPCAFLAECHRVLAPGGRLVILTPNISTYFTALQVLLGKMPSSGPHPDSNALLEAEQGMKLSDGLRDDVSSDSPQHRHLVVFSYRVLKRHLEASGFRVTQARGFGWYPLPGWMQAPFERLDPWHCHQMVFICRKEG